MGSWLFLFVFKCQGGEEKSAVEGEPAEGGDAADTLSDLKDDDEDSVSALLAPPPTPRPLPAHEPK